MSALQSVPPSPAGARWEALRAGFLPCHRDAVNLWLHAVTTPLGLVGAFAALAALHPVVPVAVALLLAVWVLERVPWRISAATAVVRAATVALGLLWSGPWWAGLLALAAGYLGQELAHRLTGEPTFEASYRGQAGWLGQFAEHSALLVPLILDAMAQHDALFAPFVPNDRTVFGHLTSPAAQAHIQTLKDWVLGQDLPLDRTTHWWARDRPEDVRAAFYAMETSEEIQAMIQARFGGSYEVQPVHRMNEVYVASECPKLTSDTVFYMSHIDGPVGIFPFSSVYRCLVAITPNRRVTTHFPMDSVDYEQTLHHTLTEGDVLAFDFNRELHYITEDSEVGPRLSEVDGRRVTLKLQFAIAPRPLRRWGWLHGQLTGRYNEIARQVFLDTIAPQSLRERLGALWVVTTTRSFEVTQRWLGLNNVAYALAAGLLSLAVGSLDLFVLLTGFVHYGLYIATFAHRRDVSHGAFVRDSVFFKGVSMGTLAVVAALNFTAEPVAIAMMVLGFGVAGLAALALGKSRTYFGVELGRVPPTRLSRFPYGYLPHPMITGAIVGLLGLHALSGFREELPWVVPVHVALYLLHLVQEQVDAARRFAPTAAPSADHGDDQDVQAAG